jgi:hypothetical protein
MKVTKFKKIEKSLATVDKYSENEILEAAFRNAEVFLGSYSYDETIPNIVDDMVLISYMNLTITVDGIDNLFDRFVIIIDEDKIVFFEDI